MGMLGSVLGSVIGSRMGGPLGGALGGALGGGMGGGFGGGMGGGLGGGFGGGLGGGMARGGGGVLGSPVAKALMLLLAGKMAADYMGRRQGGGGGFGGGLAGMAGGGGLGALIEQFRRNGQGQAVDSWVRPGPNERLTPQQLAAGLGDETVQDLERQTGLPRDQLLDQLADTLPDTVDQLTPDGRVPRDEDLIRD